MPCLPVLPLCFGVPVAIIQGPHCCYPVLPQLLPLVPARPSSPWGLSHSPSLMASMVAPRNPVQCPTLRKNVPTTCSLASRWLKAVALSIWISERPLPPSEHSSSPSIDPGTFPRHSWLFTRSAATTSAPRGVRRAKTWPLCQLMSGNLGWNKGNPKTKS